MLVLMAVLCLILLITVFYILPILLNLVDNYITLCRIPGPPAKSIIGGSVAHLFTSQEVMFDKLREWGRNYYPIYRMTIMHAVIVWVLHPKDFEIILSSSRHIEKSEAYYVLHDWLGTGLLTSTGQKWFNRRRILTPAFHFSILQQCVDVFNKQTEELVENFKKLYHKSGISIDYPIAQFTLKNIAETSMGTKLKFITKKEMDYRQAIIDLKDIITYRIIHSWFVNSFVNMFSPKYFEERRAIRTLQQFTREVIADRERTFEKIDFNFADDEIYTGKKRLAMLDLLLTAKYEEKSIDDEGIREEVDTFLFEAHDTTSVALSFALMLIACNKNVQDLIVDEIMCVMGDLRQKPTYADLQNMKYLDRTLKEVLRIYPSVPIISRKIREDVITATGYKLPKNTIVQLHIYDLHHNPEFYPDPEKFDPDRFLPENSKVRHPFAYLPFSAGPRNCIGQKFAMLELKTALCGILTNYMLEPVDTPKTVVLLGDIVLRTKDKIKVKFVSRPND